MNTVAGVVAVLLSYLLGSVSFAVVVSRAMGLADPRSYGSGNPGATNVLRTGNRAAAVLTLAGDGLKGWVAVFLVRMFAARFGFEDGVLALSAVAVFCGHLFPVFHRFQGGKGVATAAGVLTAISPWLGLSTLGTWLIIAFFFRYSSLASLVSAAFAPFCYVMLFGTDLVALAVVTMSGLLAWRHRRNISQLFAGKESRLGASKAGHHGPGKTAHNAAGKTAHNAAGKTAHNAAGKASHSAGAGKAGHPGPGTEGRPNAGQPSVSKKVKTEAGKPR